MCVGWNHGFGPTGVRKAVKLLAVLVATVSALTLAGFALAAASFSDPPGDNNSAPDMSSVTVSESADGMLTVAVAVSNFQALPTNSWFNLWFDLDSNASTGDDGDEALVQYFDDGGLQFHRWNGSALVRRPATGMTATFTAGLLTFTGPKTAFDNVTSFNLLTVASRGQDVGDDDELVASDVAPNNGRGRYLAPGPLSVAELAGDHEGAPDVTSVKVTDSKSGMLSFVVSTPSHATLTPSTWVELDVDIDRRRATGDGGVEAYAVLSGGRTFVGRWSAEEDDFVNVPRSGVRARSAGGVVTFDVPRSFLEDVASFDFYLISGDSDEDDEDNAIDFAPNGDTWWKYKLANKPPLHLIASEPRGIPTSPRAGKAFTVAVPVRRSDTARGITSGSAACTVLVGGKPVEAVGRVAAGIGRCAVTVPAGHVRNRDARFDDRALGRQVRGNAFLVPRALTCGRVQPHHPELRGPPRSVHGVRVSIRLPPLT